MHLIIGEADGYIKEKNGTTYLVFTSTDGNKKVLAEFTQLWVEIKHDIETINVENKVSIKKIWWK